MLTLTLTELERRIRRHAGFATTGTLETVEQSAVDDAIRMGLRWFYFGNDHNWSFLRTLGTGTLASGATRFNLPSDFVRLASTVTISGSNQPLAMVSSSMLQNYAQNEGAPGIPRVYAIETQHPDSETGYEMAVYPASNADATTVTFWYMFDPDAPSVSSDPYGGAQHAECIISACVAAMEQLLNPETERASAKMAEYEARLERAIAIDLQTGGPA